MLSQIRVTLDQGGRCYVKVENAASRQKVLLDKGRKRHQGRERMIKVYNVIGVENVVKVEKTVKVVNVVKV